VTDKIRREFKREESVAFVSVEEALTIGSGLNAILDNDSGDTIERRWERIRQHLNTLARVYAYPPLKTDLWGQSRRSK
jgi:hypothetical protein